MDHMDSYVAWRYAEAGILDIVAEYSLSVMLIAVGNRGNARWNLFGASWMTEVKIGHKICLAES